MIAIGPLVGEIFLFESVNGHTHGQTPTGLVYYKLALLAFSSGELKYGRGTLLTLVLEKNACSKLSLSPPARRSAATDSSSESASAFPLLEFVHLQMAM